MGIGPSTSPTKASEDNRGLNNSGTTSRSAATHSMASAMVRSLRPSYIRIAGAPPWPRRPSMGHYIVGGRQNRPAATHSRPYWPRTWGSCTLGGDEPRWPNEKVSRLKERRAEPHGPLWAWELYARMMGPMGGHYRPIGHDMSMWAHPTMSQGGRRPRAARPVARRP